MPVAAQPTQPPDILVETYHKLAAEVQFLEKAAGGDDYQNAVNDCTVNTLVPSMQRMCVALSHFVQQTISIVSGMQGEMQALSEHIAETESESQLTEEDAAMLKQFTLASIGVADKFLDAQMKAEFMAAAKKVLEFIEANTLREEPEDEVGAEEGQG